MTPADRPRPRRTALVIASLALLVALIVIWRSSSPSTPASTAEGTPTLDPDAWPEIHAELVASTELIWDPRTDWDPGADVVISAEGDLFVSQVRDWNIVVIDETGDVVRTIGRQGEGPGDFQLLSAIWFRGDTLAASDRQLFRVSYFDTDGRFLDSRRRTADVAPNPADFADYRVLFLPGAPPSTILTNGLALVAPNHGLLALENRSATGAQYSGYRIPLLTMDEDGEIVDTLAWEEQFRTVFGMARGGRVFRVAVPFQRRTHTAVLPSGGGVVVVREEDSAGPAVLVTRIGPAADTVFARTYPYTPTPHTDALLRRALREAMVVTPGGAPATEDDRAPDGAEFEGPLRRSGVIPVNLPGVTGLAVGQDDSIWLRREEREGDSVDWTVLDGMGQVLGVVTLPRAQEVVAARGTVMAAVEEDELGRVTLVRYRLGLPARQGAPASRPPAVTRHDSPHESVKARHREAGIAVGGTPDHSLRNQFAADRAKRGDGASQFTRDLAGAMWPRTQCGHRPEISPLGLRQTIEPHHEEAFVECGKSGCRC